MEHLQGKRVLLIVNPTAGKMKSKSGMFEIVHQFRGQGMIPMVFTTVKKGDAAELAMKYAGENDLVACAGGDGTLNEVITGLLNAGLQIPIAYIPAGSTNDMAATLHLPRGIHRATKAALEGGPVPHDVGRFNGEAYFSYVASFGAFTKVSYATPQWLKNRFGHFAYVLDGIGSLGDIRPYRVRVSGGGQELEGEFVFGSVTNSISVAGIMRLKPDQVCLNDGKFEVLLIRNPHNAADLRNILYGLLHQKYDEKYVSFFHADAVSLSFEKPAAWTLDGEFGGAPETARIENLRGAVQLLREAAEEPAAEETLQK